MNCLANESPIIILGMHRSGTSILTKEITKQGVFLGNDHDRNNESKFFINLNEKLLKDSGGSWDNATPIKWLIEDNSVKNLYKKYLTSRFDSIAFRKYISESRLPTNWGWKDPRNTFTLPIWREIFPNSRIIVIERHGLDVALSLMKRRAEYYKDNMKKLDSRKYLYRFFSKRGTFVDTMRCNSMMNSLSLWHEYSLTARSHEGTLVIRFEDFVCEPTKTMKLIGDHLGISISPQMKFEVDAKKAFSYKEILGTLNLSIDEKRHATSLLNEIGYEL